MEWFGVVVGGHGVDVSVVGGGSVSVDGGGGVLALTHGHTLVRGRKTGINKMT